MQFALEEAENGVVPGAGNERFRDAIQLPEFFRRGQLAVFRDQQGQRHAGNFLLLHSLRAFAEQRCNPEINLLRQQADFDLFGAGGDQGEVQFRLAPAHGLEQSRKVLAEDRFRCGDAQIDFGATTQAQSDFIDSAEEWLDEPIEFSAGFREFEGPAMK